ncbi:MAG: cation diffusion facilitator family transporter [Candidatus Cloacimonetes bacterium]|jgi:cation diffusion facilitator family transporter|nr:cation diffusion facilitator family transporter [Candidatus Cloacimonadota bacterium]
MNKKKEIKKITLWGLVLNVLISIIKFVLGFLGNSQAVVADATHSFSDTSTDLVILLGVKYWTAPPDSSHPYGHQKIESFITILIGVILLSAAGGIGYHAIATINKGHTESLKLFTIIGPIISIIFKELLFHKTYKIGVKTNSSSVKANAWHHRTDAFSSIPVLIAVVASLIDPKLIILDHIGAIIVAAFIIKLAIGIIYNNINELVDTGISDEEIQNISKIITSHSDVKGHHKIRTRKLGNSIYLDLHLQVDGDLSVLKGHDVTEEVKSALLRCNSRIIDVMVHLEPEE